MKKHIGKILVALVVVYLLVNMAAVITYPNQYKVIKTMGKISRVTRCLYHLAGNRSC